MRSTTICQKDQFFLKQLYLPLFFTFCLLGFGASLYAQATLSLQGILKKANGAALEDGTYSIKFNIYAVDGTPAGILWTETNPSVELNGGIYSVFLGEIQPLSLAFDQEYELGIQLGSQEMTPRVKLTSAPYALALRGSSNQFPSAGLVLADEIKVADGVLASGGAPGTGGVDKNGYAFSGNGGDNDSGLFSTGDGEVSIYVNNSEKIEVKDAQTTFLHPAVAPLMGTNQLNLYNNGGVNYSTDGGSFAGWRLVDIDDFSGGPQGWGAYAPLINEWTGWNQTSATSLNNPNWGAFAGSVITPTNNRHVLKKQFTVPGPVNYTQIKVKFRYYFLDSWDQGLGDVAFAGFATSVNGSTFRMAWRSRQEYANSNGRLNEPAPGIRAALDIQGQASHTDHWLDVEMTAQANGNNFWVFIGAALDSDGNVTTDESFAVGHVEVWVR